MSGPQDTSYIEDILAPIAGAEPAGTSIEYAPERDALQKAVNAVKAKAEEPRNVARELLRQARLAKKNSSPDCDRLEQEANRANLQEKFTSVSIGLAEWNTVRELAISTLTKKSKDLSTAVVLVDALTSTNAFVGLADGLVLLKGLLDKYWDGLFPALEGAGPQAASARASELERLDRQLPLTIIALPLTSGKTAYTIQHIQRSRAKGPQLEAARQDGWPGPQQLQKAVDALGAQRRDALEDQIARCENELKALDATCRERFGNQAPSFKQIETALADCKEAIARPNRSEAPAGRKPPDDPASSRSTDSEQSADNGNGAGATALDLVRQSRLEGLRIAQEDLMNARSGRQRFLRQLALAELCIEAQVESLAFPLLDELGTTADARKLEEWEDPEVLDQMWAALERVAWMLRTVKSDAVKRSEEAAEKRAQLRGQPPAPAQEAADSKPAADEG